MALRPLSLGEIFDGAFQAIRTNPATMIGFSAVVLTVATLLTVLPQALLLTGLGDSPVLRGSQEADLEDLAVFAARAGEAAVLPALLTFLAVTVLNALLVVAVSSAVLGRRVGPGELWRRVRGRVLAVLGLTLLTAVATALAVVAGLVPGLVALAAGGRGWAVLLLVLGGIAGIVGAVLLWVRWSLAGPALLLEARGVGGALARSWRLVGGSWWRVFGIQLLAAVVVAVTSQIVQTPFALLGALAAVGEAEPYASLPRTLVQLLVTGVGTVLSGAVLYPFSSAVTALLYVDLRMRREGLDVQLMQAASAPPGQAGPGW